MKEGELRTVVDGLHSPFGLLGKIRNERQLSLQEVLWEDPWMLLVLENADQPRQRHKSDKRHKSDTEDLPVIEDF